MKMRLTVPALACAFLVFAGSGCSALQAKLALKDGNKAYKEENFKKAIEYYEKAIKFDPEMGEAYFYMGSSHQALFRPGKDSPENKAHLEAAVDLYKKSLDKNKADTEDLKQAKRNALAALTSIYSDEPFKNYDTAIDYAKRLIADNPTEIKNLFAMAALYEKFEKYPDAEQAYATAWEKNPKEVKACAALAGFYNKAYWDGKSQFDKAIEILNKCAEINPDCATGYYKVAVFYWDKAYRDRELNDKQKDHYADAGLEAVEKAIKIKSDYAEAYSYKGLLLREKAKVTSDPRLRQQYLESAGIMANEYKRLKSEGAAPPTC